MSGMEVVCMGGTEYEPVVRISIMASGVSSRRIGNEPVVLNMPCIIAMDQHAPSNLCQENVITLGCVGCSSPISVRGSWRILIVQKSP